MSVTFVVVGWPEDLGIWCGQCGGVSVDIFPSQRRPAPSGIGGSVAHATCTFRLFF